MDDHVNLPPLGAYEVIEVPALSEHCEYRVGLLFVALNSGTVGALVNVLAHEGPTATQCRLTTEQP